MKMFKKIALISVVFFLLGSVIFLNLSFFYNYRENSKIKKVTQTTEQAIPTNISETSIKKTDIPEDDGMSFELRFSEEFTQKGSVSGRLGYPGENIPQLEVYFINQDSKNKNVTIITSYNQSEYFLQGLADGKYIAVAYVKDQPETSGAYTEAVLCGLTIECTDHSPVVFEIKDGNAAKNIYITDWYAPKGVLPEINSF